MLHESPGNLNLISAPSMFSVGEAPRALVVADLGNGAALDVAAANETSADVSVLFGSGDGTFEAEIRIAAGTEPHRVVAADLDNDGDRDLVLGSKRSRR